MEGAVLLRVSRDLFCGSLRLLHYFCFVFFCCFVFSTLFVYSSFLLSRSVDAGLFSKKCIVNPESKLPRELANPLFAILMNTAPGVHTPLTRTTHRTLSMSGQEKGRKFNIQCSFDLLREDNMGIRGFKRFRAYLISIPFRGLP